MAVVGNWRESCREKVHRLEYSYGEGLYKIEELEMI